MSEEDCTAPGRVRPEGLGDLLTALRELEAAQRQLLARLAEIQRLQQVQRQLAQAEASQPRVLH
ncbi:MAG TPA: hypothetical protein VFV18_06960 [Porticoccaceae bacterium]|nr:hypothetical protein [Porticoccaceae bacterium]